MEETDLEKVKIEILRDSFKDTVDTIRAMDRKLKYIMSFNIFAISVLGAVLVKFEEYFNNNIFYVPIVIASMSLIFFWVINLTELIKGFTPEINPLSIFSNDDKNFGNNCFFMPVKFISNNYQDLTINLNEILKNFDNEINSEEKIKKLLFKEIIKVSYIRDVKVDSVKDTIETTKYLVWFSILFFILTFIIKNYIF